MDCYYEKDGTASGSESDFRLVSFLRLFRFSCVCRRARKNVGGPETLRMAGGCRRRGRCRHPRSIVGLGRGCGLGQIGNRLVVPRVVKFVAWTFRPFVKSRVSPE